jgi:hypothetical protein
MRLWCRGLLGRGAGRVMYGCGWLLATCMAMHGERVEQGGFARQLWCVMLGQRDDVSVHFFVRLLRCPHLPSRAGSYDDVCLMSSDVTLGDAGEASQAGKFKNGNTTLSIGPSFWPVVVADYGSSSNHIRLKKKWKKVSTSNTQAKQG